MKKLWDISPPVRTGSPVFPGDTPYQQQWAATLGPGCPVNVSTLTLSPHVGAHADAPLHYDPTGASVGELDLAPYLGPCRVIHAIGVGPLIEWRTWPTPSANCRRACWCAPTRACRWTAGTLIWRPLRRRPSSAWPRWAWCWSASTPPASTPLTARPCDSHQVIRRLNLRVLENLVLDDVPEGDYELIALPLKLMTADASPVRAVLRELP
jgi:arylformamidase